LKGEESSWRKEAIRECPYFASVCFLTSSSTCCGGCPYLPLESMEAPSPATSLTTSIPIPNPPIVADSALSIANLVSLDEELIRSLRKSELRHHFLALQFYMYARHCHRTRYLLQASQNLLQASPFLQLPCFPSYDYLSKEGATFTPTCFRVSSPTGTSASLTCASCNYPYHSVNTSSPPSSLSADSSIARLVQSSMAQRTRR
jgi:hypothetical protein